MLPLAKYEIYFEADESVRIPNPPGLLWHSVFGKALHEVSCTHPNKACNDCLRLHDCDYPVLFKPALPPGAQIMTKYPQIPPPHLFQFSDSGLTGSELNSKSIEFSIELILIGDANERLATALQAMQKLGQNGIGKNRIPARITRIKRHRQKHGAQWLHESDNEFDKPEIISVPELPRDIAVRFVSPYSPPGNRSASPDRFDLSAFLMAVVRRIDLLSYFYSGKKLEANFKSLKTMSSRTHGVAADLKSSTVGHYSAKHAGSFNKSGVIGSLSLNTDLWEMFWPYLYTGQYLNCGKKASYGLGQYRVVGV